MSTAPRFPLRWAPALIVLALCAPRAFAREIEGPCTPGAGDVPSFAAPLELVPVAPPPVIQGCRDGNAACFCDDTPRDQGPTDCQAFCGLGALRVHYSDDDELLDRFATSSPGLPNRPRAWCQGDPQVLDEWLANRRLRDDSRLPWTWQLLDPDRAEGTTYIGPGCGFAMPPRNCRGPQTTALEIKTNDNRVLLQTVAIPDLDCLSPDATIQVKMRVQFPDGTPESWAAIGMRPVQSPYDEGIEDPEFSVDGEPQVHWAQVSPASLQQTSPAVDAACQSRDNCGGSVEVFDPSSLINDSMPDWMRGALDGMDNWYTVTTQFAPRAEQFEGHPYVALYIKAGTFPDREMTVRIDSVSIQTNPGTPGGGDPSCHAAAGHSDCN